MPGPGQELRTVFLEEVPERLRKAGAILDGAASRRAPFAAAELISPLRAVYSARTGALFAGATEVAEALAAVEGALDRLMAARVVEPTEVLPVRRLLTAVLSALDRLKAGVASSSDDLRTMAADLAGAPPPPAVAPLPATPPGVARPAAAPPQAPPATGPGTDEGDAGPVEWVPLVPEDMLEPFFEETGERLEGVADKLLKMEETPDDRGLLDDLFRDVHTVKGGAAIVGLAPMNRLAHRMEDFLGEVRAGQRSFMQPDIDLLLTGVDRLKQMAGQARDRAPIHVGFADLLQGLGAGAALAPGTAGAPAPAPRVTPPAPPEPRPVPGPPSAPAPAQPAEAPPPGAAPPARRATLRVDFGKLDDLLNLVGEFVMVKSRVQEDAQNLDELQAELEHARRTLQILEREGVADDLGRVLRDVDRSLREAATSGAGAGEAVADLRQTVQRIFERAAEEKERGIAERVRRVDEELLRFGKLLERLTEELTDSTGALELASRELQHQVMNLRMVPIGTVFTKYRRTVRDLARELGKEIRLEIEGAETELDKVLVERIDDPLMHLIRNACDHGVQKPDVRRASGKPAMGTVTLRAFQRGNEIVIEIADDGAGIPVDRVREKARASAVVPPERLDTMTDHEALNLVFLPGFSTARTVSAVSGRGVGMDVVRDAITRLKGSIDVSSEVGKGTTFRLRLPLTLAIIQVLLVRVSGELLAVPISGVERSIRMPASQVSEVLGEEVIEQQGDSITLVRLHEALGLQGEAWDASEAGEVSMVVVESYGRVFGLVVDDLVSKSEVVIKSMGDLLQEVPKVAGATLFGERCVLILDVNAILEAVMRGDAVTATPRAAVATDREQGPAPEEPRSVLLVEDSDIVRRSIRRVMEEAGLRVTEARDGAEALELARGTTFDVVSTDVMMPRLDGYELTRALRLMDTYAAVPIIMITSKGEKIDKIRGFDAGVDDYLVKPFGKAALLEILRRRR